MNSSLGSPWLQLEIDAERCTFTLSDLTGSQARLGPASYYFSFSTSALPGPHGPLRLSLRQADFGLKVHTPNGLLSYASLIYDEALSQQEFTVELGLLEDQALLLSRMALKNNSEHPIFPERLTIFDTQNLRFGAAVPDTEAQLCFYSNGWQSWSPAAVYQPADRQQRTRLGFLTEPMINNSGTPVFHQRGHFSSDMFALLGDRSSGCGIVAGFLSQKEQFGSLTAQLTHPPQMQMWADADRVLLAPGSQLVSDWAAIGFTNLASPAPFAVYLQAAARENHARIPPEAPLGWCSWYQYFTKIDERVLRANLQEVTAHASELPLNLFQIDDGYEQSVGNWFEFNERFPHGLGQLSAEIRQAGLTPGIWLAPFILQRNSPIIKRHPEWLLRNRRGRPVNAGFGWNTLTTAFDLTNPEALEYTRAVIRKAVSEWGFPYLKLDFLYAAALPGKHADPTRTRAQVLRTGLEAIRQEAGPDATLLGCGCPLGSAIGIVDLMRISEDVAPSWEPNFMGLRFPFRKEPSMPCARNAIQNILTRADLDQYWWRNDPDCLLVRPDSELSLAEVQTLATTIAMTGGALLLSDDLTRLPAERLHIAQSLMPPLQSAAQIRGRFAANPPSNLLQKLTSPAGEYWLLALFNWSAKPADLTFIPAEWGFDPAQEWIGREFWTGEVFTIRSGRLDFRSVAAHGCRLFGLRPLDGQPLYLGSDIHFSQGMEVSRWAWNGDSLELTLDVSRAAQGSCLVYCPDAPTAIEQDGQPLSIEALPGQLLRLPLSLPDMDPIILHFK